MCVPFSISTPTGSNVIGIKYFHDDYRKKIEKLLTFIFTDGILIKSLTGDREIVL